MGKVYVWTKDTKEVTLSAMSSVLAGVDVDIEVVNDMNHLPPEGVILALGKEPLEILANIKLVIKGRTITSQRKSPKYQGKRTFLISYSPRIYEVDYGMYVDFLCDVRLAIRLATTGTIEPVLGDYQYVEDFTALCAAIQDEYDRTGKPVDVCHDTETIGLDPVPCAPQMGVPDKRFVTWQFSYKPGHTYVKYFKSPTHFQESLDKGLMYEQIKWLLTTPMISLRLANGKFDLMWHWWHTRLVGQAPHMECTNFKLDSTLVGSLIDENRSNSLNIHAKIYTNIGGYDDVFNQTVDKSRMDLVPMDKMLPYAAGDTDAGLQVAAKLRTELLKDNRLAAFYVNVLHPAARAFEVIERTGVCVDMAAYAELESELNKTLTHATLEAKKIIGGILVAKHKKDDAPGGINLTKASLLTDFMFGPQGLKLKPKMLTEKTKAPSSKMEHLDMFADVPEAAEFIRLVGEYQGAAKTLSTYVKGFQSYLRGDGRLHPDYFLHVGDEDEDEGGAVTGRLSARSPAIQTVPKHTAWGKRIRRVFCAPPGHMVLERDYSQGELKVVACIGQVNTMLEAYRKGMDLHVLTGARIAGLDYDFVKGLEKTFPDRYDKIRTPAKPANFGLLYGQGVPGFRNYAERNYGVKLSMDEAENISRAFFELYPELLQYHAAMKGMAHKFMRVRSPLGRVRHLPLINSKHYGTRSSMERKAVNAPVQAALSDMMIWALGLENAEGGFKVSPAVAVIHDAAYDYVPEDNWEAIVKHKRDLMENLPFEKVGWKPQLKFTVDCKVGPNFADLKKAKL